jgi:hypothetical protein
MLFSVIPVETGIQSRSTRDLNTYKYPGLPLSRERRLFTKPSIKDMEENGKNLGDTWRA